MYNIKKYVAVKLKQPKIKGVSAFWKLFKYVRGEAGSYCY